MSEAVCIRCGSTRAHFDQICPACGFRPEAEGLLVAWLLSDKHLSPAELQTAAARIKNGQPIRPTEAQLQRARQALRWTFDEDPGLTIRDCALLLATGILLTPLPGWMLAWWWWRERRRSAIQALALTVPVTVLFGGGMIGLYVMGV